MSAPDRQRPLEGRRGERVVDDDERPSTALRGAPLHGVGHGRDVHHLEQRIGRRLEPDQARPLAERLPQGVRAAREVRRSVVVTPGTACGRVSR